MEVYSCWWAWTDVIWPGMSWSGSVWSGGRRFVRQSRKRVGSAVSNMVGPVMESAEWTWRDENAGWALWDANAGWVSIRHGYRMNSCRMGPGERQCRMILGKPGWMHLAFWSRGLLGENTPNICPPKRDIFSNMACFVRYLHSALGYRSRWSGPVLSSISKDHMPWLFLTYRTKHLSLPDQTLTLAESKRGSRITSGNRIRSGSRIKHFAESVTLPNHVSECPAE